MDINYIMNERAIPITLKLEKIRLRWLKDISILLLKNSLALRTELLMKKKEVWEYLESEALERNPRPLQPSREAFARTIVLPSLKEENFVISKKSEDIIEKIENIDNCLVIFSKENPRQEIVDEIYQSSIEVFHVRNCQELQDLSENVYPRPFFVIVEKFFRKDAFKVYQVNENFLKLFIMEFSFQQILQQFDGNPGVQVFTGYKDITKDIRKQLNFGSFLPFMDVQNYYEWRAKKINKCLRQILSQTPTVSKFYVQNYCQFLKQIYYDIENEFKKPMSRENLEMFKKSESKGKQNQSQITLFVQIFQMADYQVEILQRKVGKYVQLRALQKANRNNRKIYTVLQIKFPSDSVKNVGYGLPLCWIEEDGEKAILNPLNIYKVISFNLSRKTILIEFITNSGSLLKSYNKSLGLKKQENLGSIFSVSKGSKGQIIKLEGGQTQQRFNLRNGDYQIRLIRYANAKQNILQNLQNLNIFSQNMTHHGMKTLKSLNLKSLSSLSLYNNNFDEVMLKHLSEFPMVKVQKLTFIVFKTFQYKNMDIMSRMFLPSLKMLYLSNSSKNLQGNCFTLLLHLPSRHYLYDSYQGTDPRKQLIKKTQQISTDCFIRMQRQRREKQREEKRLREKQEKQERQRIKRQEQQKKQRIIWQENQQKRKLLLCL